MGLAVVWCKCGHPFVEAQQRTAWGAFVVWMDVDGASLTFRGLVEECPTCGEVLSPARVSDRGRRVEYPGVGHIWGSGCCPGPPPVGRDEPLEE